MSIGIFCAVLSPAVLKTEVKKKYNNYLDIGRYNLIFFMGLDA
ncbi:MAG: hypothetical protein AABY51_04070 [Deltaproteobacteria bacterium]